MKILVPLDGSENSMRAAAHALQIAQECKDREIYLISVVYPFSSSQAGSDMEKARKLFKAAGVNVHIKILEGDPGETIIKYIDEQNMEAVIMGSRGKSALQGIILGSVSKKVLTKAKIPVTIVN